MDKYRLDVRAIEQSLRDVQREFPKINELLHSRRDSMTDDVLNNMLAGYAFVDQAIADGIDLFTLRHATALLELNHIVLCGLDEQIRQAYQTHLAQCITATRGRKGDGLARRDATCGAISRILRGCAGRYRPVRAYAHGSHRHPTGT